MCLFHLSIFYIRKHGDKKGEKKCGTKSLDEFENIGGKTQDVEAQIG